MKVTGLCVVVAATALSALAPAGASAVAPEYGRCLKVAAEKEGSETVYHGGYTDSKCTKASPTKIGKYEWYPGAENRKFTTSGGVATLTTVGSAEVECQKESSGGEFVARKQQRSQAGIFVKFTGCNLFGRACTTPGAASGELITNELEGLVGWESKAAKKTALELSPAKSVSSGLFIEFSCTGLVVKVKGHVLVPIKNDKMTSTETLKFSAKKGKQKPEKWEESSGLTILEASFKGGPFEQAGQEITSTITGSKKNWSSTRSFSDYRRSGRACGVPRAPACPAGP